MGSALNYKNLSKVIARHGSLVYDTPPSLLMILINGKKNIDISIKIAVNFYVYISIYFFIIIILINNIIPVKKHIVYSLSDKTTLKV